MRFAVWRQALVAGLAALAGAAHGAEPLWICMAENNAPHSERRGNEARGFDVNLGRVLAERVGRTLAIRWFESKHEKEASLALSVNAMLSAGLCDLVAGYALYEPALGAPAAATARTPDHDGAKPMRERPWIKLGALAATRPYHAVPFTVVLAPGEPHRMVRSLDDLAGLRVAANIGTLSDAILRVYGNGVLVKGIASLGQRDDALAVLERGGLDATFIELHKFDRYRGQVPATKLVASGFLHSFSFNLGYAALDTQQAVGLEKVNQVLGDLMRSGEIGDLAKEAGMTYVFPRSPDVRGPITLQTLRTLSAQ